MAARTMFGLDCGTPRRAGPAGRIALACASSWCGGHALLLAFAAGLLAAVMPGGGTAAAAAPVDFERDVAPLLSRECLTCHGAADPAGNLDLSRREGLLAGGDSGPAIAPGDAAASYLVERVREGSMPPEGKGRRLTADEARLVAEWVEAGAAWPAERVLSPFEHTTDRRAGYDWWSLQPVVRPPLPVVARSTWPRAPIDRFVLTALEQAGLSPAPEADRRTFIRRATLDLTGLPPTPDEIAAFLADDSPDAYERLVDRLLASPHYGERWARHWLDVVRFGESDGFENDKLREHSWPYRDYVVRSFNEDRPYPRFVQEQLAGDALLPVTHDGLAATGFLVAGPWDEIQNVGASKLERLRAREEQMEELVAAVSQTFLGLTVNCARCHDHKFDPLAQADYYRLKAAFDGVDHGNRPLLTPSEQTAHDAAVVDAQARLDAAAAELAALGNLAPGDAAAQGDATHGDTAALLVEGRFSLALDGRAGHFAAPTKPAYAAPPLTVECWTRLDSSAGFNILVAQQNKESSEHWEIYTYAGSGEFSAYLPGYSPAEIKSGVAVTDGAWHHVAMTFDGSRVRLFVDGALSRDEAVTRQRTGGTAGELTVGAYPPQGIRCDGLVDEVRISRGVREFSAAPDAPLAADKETLGLWRFDELADRRTPDAAPLPEKSADAAAAAARAEELTALRSKLEAEIAALAPPLAYSGTMRQPEPTVLFRRGDVKNPGEQVAPAALSALARAAGDYALPADAPESERRLRFAAWVVGEDNPLTARVLVNRVWQWHFGRGLVETPSDFGFSGGRPSHPKLLDWLAAEFVAGGWSVKRLHRAIVLSATYRQSAAHDPAAAAVDADNRLLWHFAPRRLEAEAVRDAMLAASGELNPAVGGPGFRPFTVTKLLTSFYHPRDIDAPDQNRRSLYRTMVNTARHALLDSLDCPAPSIASPLRRHTTTPLQALSLMNDSFVLRQAERLAARLRTESADDTAAQVRLAFRLTLSREATDEELAAAVRLADEQRLETVCWALFNASEFLYLP